MTTPLQKTLVAGSDRAGVSGNLIKDYIEVGSNEARFKERDADGDVQTVTVDLTGQGLVVVQSQAAATNAELKTLDTDYLEVIAAPGAGKYLQLHQAWTRKRGSDLPPEITRIYRSAVSADDTLTETEALAGVLSTNTFLALPDWSISSYLFVGVGNTQPDLHGLNVPTVEEPHDYFDRVFEAVPGTLMVDGVPTKWWRTKVAYDSRSTYGYEYHSVRNADAPSAASVSTRAALSFIMERDSSLSRPLCQRSDAHVSLVSNLLANLLAEPANALFASSIGGHGLLANTPLLLGVDLANTFRSSRDSYYDSGAHDDYLNGVDDVSVGYTLRYEILDVRNPP